jgi:GNAT acetyltransferase-like protein
MTVEFRYAGFDEYEKVRRFLDSYWATDHVYVRVPQLFHWTFQGNSLWDRDEYCLALAEDHGEIVGMLGGIPFVFNCLGDTSPAVWIVNYIVRPDYRRGSTALRLLDMFRRPFGTVISFGNNPAVVPLYRALRARILMEIPRHFMILPHAMSRLANLLRITYPDWRSDRAEKLAAYFQVADIPPVSIPSINYLSTNWDEDGWPQFASKLVGAARDFDYLTWRYQRHPCFRYRFITVQEGNRMGLLIWRLETIRRVTLHGLEDVDRIGRLVEFLPSSRNNAKDLLALLWHELAEADAFAADYYGYHGESRRWLQESGFREISGHPDGPALPSRFQPLEPKGGNILSALFVADQVPACSTDYTCNWYWTKSDSDQDRPN